MSDYRQQALAIESLQNVPNTEFLGELIKLMHFSLRTWNIRRIEVDKLHLLLNFRDIEKRCDQAEAERATIRAQEERGHTKQQQQLT
jgi:hypothetical protein